MNPLLVMPVALPIVVGALQLLLARAAPAAQRTVAVVTLLALVGLAVYLVMLARNVVGL